MTPAPWRIETTPYIHVRSDAGCVLAADYTTPENAALISAAPDLLAALEGLPYLHKGNMTASAKEHGVGIVIPLRRALEAIAKARP